MLALVVLALLTAATPAPDAARDGPTAAAD
jgi:hypothetical protein